MSGGTRNGFTLVEILIVVVILGILAALVIPQISSASAQAIRSTVRSQVQTIDKHIEVYKTQNQGLSPLSDPVDPMVEGGNNNGWGVLVSLDYMSEAPMNTYTGSTVVVAGDEAAALAEDRDSLNGWYYELLDPGLFVYAAGYSRATDELEHEYNP